MARPGRRRIARTIALVLGVAAVACLIWGFLVEPGRLVVHHLRLAAPVPPVRVAVVSDLHVGAPFIDLAKVRAVVERVNGERPDLVLLLGDYLIGHPADDGGVLGGRFVEPEPIAEALRGLRAPGGVFAVLGNHDWWRDGPRTARALEAVGIRVLDDQAARVALDGRAPLWLLGVVDRTTHYPRFHAALRAIPDGAPVLAFTHNPDVFPYIPRRVALTLAGHTHGGQVRLPLVGAPVIPSDFGRRWDTRLVDEAGRRMVITTGVGTSILPVRFGVPPEILVLDLAP